MIKKILAFLPCIFLIANLYGQSDNSNLRPAFELKLLVNSKQFYSSPFGETKYIVNDSIILIFPGEKLFIEADINNNKLVNLKKVDAIDNPNKTLIVEFSQESEGKSHKYMQLIITNPYDKSLHYNALMNLMKTQKWVNTSVIPIMPKLKSIEMWPDIITSLALNGFELKDK
jgi:hypothetical protein